MLRSIFCLVVFAFSSLQVMASINTESPVGTSRLKLKTGAPEIKTLITARYSMTAEQSLEMKCPQDSVLMSANCEMKTQSFERSLDFDRASTFPQMIETTLANDASANCRPRLVRPDEIVKLSMTLKCLSQNQADPETHVE